MFVDSFSSLSLPSWPLLASMTLTPTPAMSNARPPHQGSLAPLETTSPPTRPSRTAHGILPVASLLRSSQILARLYFLLVPNLSYFLLVQTKRIWRPLRDVLRTLRKKLIRLSHRLRKKANKAEAQVQGLLSLLPLVASSPSFT
jgi:hypothetical protein